MNEFTTRNILLFGHMTHMTHMTIDQEYEILRYFREHYYNDATSYRHHQYLCVLFDFKILYGRYPTRTEFFFIFHKPCLCHYSESLTEEHYVNACEFFMKMIGDILTPSCMDLYFHYEFYMLERRHPSSMTEFIEYVRRSFRGFDIDSVDTDITTGIDNEKINELKKTMEVVSNQSCSICQEDIIDQLSVKLKCGHFYHANDTDCCENGTIFTWFSKNKKCPVCRSEL